MSDDNDQADDQADDRPGSSGPEDRGEGRDRDGSLHDLQEESGDEAELDDIFSLDRLSAAQAGVELDRPPTPEAPLG